MSAPIIAVTGHRPVSIWGRANQPYSERKQHALVDFAEAVLSSLPDTTCSIRGVLTGMALGWDQAVAEACIRLSLPWVACVPFAGQDSRWPASARDHYRYLLSQATATRVISSGGYSPAAMHARNRWMVDRADVIVALYDGRPGGGTASCVEYARSLDRHVITYGVDDLLASLTQPDGWEDDAASANHHFWETL